MSGVRSGDLRRRGRDGRVNGARWGVCGALGGDVALDGDGELGEVAVANDLAELLLGFEHAGGRPAQAHVAVGPVLDVAADAPDGVDHRLARVRGGQRALEAPADAEARDGQRLLHALPQRCGGAGMAAGELVGECAQLVERAVVIVERPRPPQATTDERPVALGEVVEHVPLSLINDWMSRACCCWVGPPDAVAFGRRSVLFGACLRTPCRSELSRLLNSLWAVQSARTQLELAGTGACAPRGREGSKGCWSASTCQLAIRIFGQRPPWPGCPCRRSAA